MIDQEKIHNQCLSINQKKRISGLKQLEYNFSLLPDKQQAWEDLIELTTDHDWDVRIEAAYTLSSVFFQVPNKQKAWEDLIRLISDENSDVRIYAASAIRRVFSDVPDKQQACNDLIRLISDRDDNVRAGAVLTLRNVFSDVPDKQQACNDLMRLISDQDNNTRLYALQTLCDIFSDVPDKQQACNNLMRLISDQDNNTRLYALQTLCNVFSNLPDKQQACNNLIRLIGDQDNKVRFGAIRYLYKIFTYVPDKQQACNGLIRLISDQDDNVRAGAALAIGYVFSYAPDKQLAWNELSKLTNDKIDSVKYFAVEALGSSFSHVPDKRQAWNILIKLTSDQNNLVRSQANHSLGRFSIFKASQAENEDNYKKELEKAIEFFEISAKESSDGIFNPSEFCLPFYRSFYTIVFKRPEANEEVDIYLAETKSAIKGSKNKELLSEAIENLANALKEVQNLESLDLEAMKGELSFYRKYCDRAAELMRDTEETAPFAAITMRKGLPILDRNLRELLEEIQKKTEVIRDQTTGTPFEKLGDELNKESLSLLQVRDLVGFKKQVQNLENKLNSMCSKLPEGQKGEACELLQIIHEEHSIEDKIPLINDVLSKFSYQLDMIGCLNRIDESLSSINKKVEELIIISRPGISEEVIISTGFQLAGSGFQHSITIPLQEISYAELQEDMEKIRGKTIDKLSKLPDRLAKKIKGYLLLNDKDEILDKLT